MGVGQAKQIKYIYIYIKQKGASLSKTLKSPLQVDNAGDLSTPGILISVHQYMITRRAAPIEGESACSARDLEEYEDVRGDTRLEDCGSVEVEMRNGEMGVKYV